MNFGGDPGQDDYGLPPVDIEVPDDARELDRDVQAYYRELRAQRRRVLARRLYAPLTRDGMVLPLLACCLALTLLSGTLLTIFTAGPGPAAPGRGTARPQRNSAQPQLSTAQPGQSPARQGGQAAHPHGGTGNGQPAGILPNVTVLVDGQRERLRALTGTVLLLALVPPACRCGTDVRQLAEQGRLGGAKVYLLGTNGAKVTRLSVRVGLGRARAVEDSANLLPPAYRPARLTAVLVDPNGSVARVVRDLGHGFQLTADLRALTRSP